MRSATAGYLVRHLNDDVRMLDSDRDAIHRLVKLLAK
jgi:hypothetical protein